MREIIKVTGNGFVDLSEYGLNMDEIEIFRLWTVFDQELMKTWCEFNPQTGEPVVVNTLDDVILKHREGVFLEDYVHDWNIYIIDGKHQLKYYSRIIKKGEETKVLIEYRKKLSTIRKLVESGRKSWDVNLKKEVNLSPNTINFLEDYEILCKKYGLTLSYGEGGEEFIIEGYNQSNVEEVCRAAIKTSDTEN